MESNIFFSSQHETNIPQKKYAHIERGGLIPITSYILNLSSITEDETVEYRDVQLGDIIIVGYIIDYKVFEAKVKILIWDQTGTIEVTFFNGNEETNGLNNIIWDEKKNKVVKIFGTVKVYKKEKNIQGAKIILLKDNDIFHHCLQVMNSWLYLSGRLNELKKGNFENEIYNAREIAKNAKGNIINNNYNNNNRNYNSNNYVNNNSYEIAQNILNEISRSGNRNIKKGELNSILVKNSIRSDEIGKVIKNLIDEGYIMENDESYYIY